jgi:hypothetical protein
MLKLTSPQGENVTERIVAYDRPGSEARGLDHDGTKVALPDK